MMFFGYDRAKEGMSNAPGASHGDSYVRMLQTKEEIAKQIGTKSNQDGFDTVIRLVVSSNTRSRAIEIMSDCIVSLSLFKDPSMNYFQTRRIIPLHSINSPWMLHNFSHRIFSFGEKINFSSGRTRFIFFTFRTAATITRLLLNGLLTRFCRRRLICRLPDFCSGTMFTVE